MQPAEPEGLVGIAHDHVRYWQAPNRVPVPNQDSCGNQGPREGGLARVRS